MGTMEGRGGISSQCAPPLSALLKQHPSPHQIILLDFYYFHLFFPRLSFFFCLLTEVNEKVADTM